MTKRSKLMLGVSAMLLASAGVAATGTFAWYSMSNAGLEAGSKTAGSIASAATTAGLGTFTVNVTVANAENVCLSNDVGKTFVTDGSTNVEGTSAANAIASPDIMLNVSYRTAPGAGPESLNAATILGLWQAAIDGKTLTLTFSKETPKSLETFSGDGSKTQFQLDDTSLASASGVTVKVGGAAGPAISSVSDGLVTLASAPTAGTNNVTIEYTPTDAASGGVKFTTGTGDFKQDSGDNVVEIAESEFGDLEVTGFSGPGGNKADGWTSTASMSDGTISNKVFMGLIGLNNVIQDHWTYSYSFTASIG